MARPTKTIHRVQQMLSCYQTDLDFFNDHRGKMTISAYLIEAGHHFAGDVSRYEKVITELQAAKQEIQELKRQLLFEQSKNQKTISINLDLEEIRKAYYFKDKTEIDRGIKQGWMNWNKIYEDHPEFKFKTKKEMQLYYTELSEQNNGQINHNSPNVTAGEVLT